MDIIVLAIFNKLKNGNTNFAYFFTTHNFLYGYHIIVYFSALTKWLVGGIMQVKDCTYSIVVLRYDLLCDSV